jgi:dipeptidyl aminopeptidase/acylaminoacyl peptidase
MSGLVKAQLRISLLPLGFLALIVLAACDGSTGPEEDPGGVDLDLLFGPPTASEKAQILGDWDSRTPSVQNVQELAQEVVPYGAEGLSMRIVSHEVDGVTHVGAIATPLGAAPGSLPVVVFSHGGDQGENLDLTLLLLPLVLGGEIDGFVFVVPAFRSESLVFGGVEYASGGESSPWDRDVDDALALLEVALSTVPEADPGSIGVLGFSRGANVGMLMAIRDPRIDAVVEFFGPTDFFGPFVRTVVEEALGGSLRELPGLEYLNQEFIQPLDRGEVTHAQVRLEMLRRSPVYFAELLPDLQVHHGTDDDVVPVGEGERLIQVMSDLGRTGPEFQGFLYEGGTHDPLSLPGAFPRTQAFLTRLTAGG